MSSCDVWRNHYTIIRALQYMDTETFSLINLSTTVVQHKIGHLVPIHLSPLDRQTLVLLQSKWLVA